MNRQILPTAGLGLIALCILAITGQSALPVHARYATAADTEVTPAATQTPVAVAQASPLPAPVSPLPAPISPSLLPWPAPQAEDGVDIDPDGEATAIGPVLVLLRPDRIDGSPGNGEVWRWEDGKLTFLAEWNSSTLPVLSPDGMRLAVVDDRGPTLSVVHIPSGYRQFYLSAHDLDPVLTDNAIWLLDEETLGAPMWTPDGSGILFATKSQNPMPPGKDDLHYSNLQSLQFGGELRTLFEPGAAGALYPSPDGNYVAIVNPAELMLLNLSTLEIVNRIRYPPVERHAGMHVFPYYPEVFWHDSSERLVLAVPDGDYGSPVIENGTRVVEINLQLFEIYTSGAHPEGIARFAVPPVFYLESVNRFILARFHRWVEAENDAVLIEAEPVLFDMADHALYQVEREEIDAWRAAWERESAQTKIVVEQEDRTTVVMARGGDRFVTLFGFNGDVVYAFELDEDLGWYQPPRQTLMEPAQPDASPSAPAGEPDGTPLAVASVVSDTVEAIYYWMPGFSADPLWRLSRHELWIWRAGVEERLAHFVDEPVFHATLAGTRVAFVDSGGIYVYDPHTHEIQEVLSADLLQMLRTNEPSPLFPKGLKWHPDGTRLWFSTTVEPRPVDPGQSEGDTEALYEIDLETSEIRQRLLPGEGGSLLLSPTGDYLALTGMNHVRVVRIADYETVNLLEFPVSRDFFLSPLIYPVKPIWSPDGTLLSVVIPQIPDGIFDLEDLDITLGVWQIPIDGAPPEQIATYPGSWGKLSPGLDAFIYTDLKMERDLDRFQAFNYLARMDGSVQELSVSEDRLPTYYWLNDNYVVSTAIDVSEPLQILDVRNMQSVWWPVGLRRHRGNTFEGDEMEPDGIWLNQTDRLVAGHSRHVDKFGIWVVGPDYEGWWMLPEDAQLVVETSGSAPLDYRVIFRPGDEVDQAEAWVRYAEELFASE